MAIIIAEFAVIEGAMRAYGGSESSAGFQSLFMQDPRVGHRPRPGAHTRYSTAEFSTDLAINAQGVRDDHDLGPKAPGERRVLVLGDSLVLSVQVDLQQTFCKRLEARLASADPAHAWRVINGGVQGYGPVDEWLFYKHVAADLEPDIVVIVPFVGNDATEANDRERWIETDGPPQDQTLDRAGDRLRRVTRSSLVLQQVRLRIDQLKAHMAGPTPERPLTSYLSDPPPGVLHGLDVSRRAFGLIATDAAGRGARTAIALMPARFQTDDADYGRLAVIVSQAGGTLIRNSASARFRSALAPLGLPLTDLQPILAAQPHREELFFQRNVHLTPRGHVVVGDALFDFLRDAGLLSE
jgi:hypothetical protein